MNTCHKVWGFPYLITICYEDTSILNLYYRLKDVPGRYGLWLLLGVILVTHSYCCFVSPISLLDCSNALIAKYNSCKQWRETYTDKTFCIDISTRDVLWLLFIFACVSYF